MDGFNPKKRNAEVKIRDAIYACDLEAMKSSIMKEGSYPITPSETYRACYADAIDCLKFLHEIMGIELEERCLSNCFEGGKGFRCLLYILKENDNRYSGKKIDFNLKSICDNYYYQRNYGKKCETKEFRENFRQYDIQLKELGYELDFNSSTNLLLQFILVYGKKHDYKFTWEDYLNLRAERIFVTKTPPDDVDFYFTNLPLQGKIPIYDQDSLIEKGYLDDFMISNFSFSKRGLFKSRCLTRFNQTVFEYICRSKPDIF